MSYEEALTQAMMLAEQSIDPSFSPEERAIRAQSAQAFALIAKVLFKKAHMVNL